MSSHAGGCLDAKIVYVEPVHCFPGTVIGYYRALLQHSSPLISTTTSVTGMITGMILRHMTCQTRTHEYILLVVGKIFQSIRRPHLVGTLLEPPDPRPGVRHFSMPGVMGPPCDSRDTAHVLLTQATGLYSTTFWGKLFPRFGKPLDNLSLQGFLARFDRLRLSISALVLAHLAPLSNQIAVR